MSPVPHKSTVERLVECFRENGSVDDTKHSGMSCVLGNKKSEAVRPVVAVAYEIAQETPLAAAYLVRGCIQKFPDWPPGARTANGTALCH
jgi:aminoglycoside N3'-acetyltransferase